MGVKDVKAVKEGDSFVSESMSQADCKVIKSAHGKQIIRRQVKYRKLLHFVFYFISKNIYLPPVPCGLPKNHLSSNT